MIPQTENIVFTNSQEIGVQLIYDFMKNNERCFVLRGKAGTGKTTIIKYALESFLVHDRKTAREQGILNGDVFNVMGVCVAHKAKENLRQSIPYVTTFASAFGQREHRKDDGERYFKIDRQALQESDCTLPWRVIVIDECSMFNYEMCKTVFDNVWNRTKIIFMGDRGQLPPIEEGPLRPKTYDIDSPVFELNIDGKCKHQLVERVRQTEGNPIIDLSDEVYKQIFSNHDLGAVKKLLYRKILDEDGLGFQSIDGPYMYNTFLNSTQNEFLDTKLLAYRRNTVRDYNKYLRDYIHHDPWLEYIPQEIIYMNKNYSSPEGFRVHNSSEHIIQSVGQGELNGVPVHTIYLDKQRFLPVLQGPYNSHSMEMYREICEQHREIRDWDNLYGFTDAFANISYGYTLTAYKAQGSTYRNVFVDVNDIFAVSKISAKRKLQALYTCITRASNMVYFIK